jgi:hypothetical protein
MMLSWSIVLEGALRPKGEKAILFLNMYKKGEVFFL